MQSRFLGPFLLVSTALLWSLGGMLIKSVDWTPMAIAAGRSAIAIPVVLLFTGRPRFTFSKWQIAAAIAYSATVICFVAATRLTTAANAIFLQYTAPIYVALFGHWLLGERARRLDWVLIAVALGGIALFFLDHLSASGWWGNILALASGVTFAAMAMLLRKEKENSPATAILLGNALTAVIGIPFMLSAPLGPGSGWTLLLLGTVQLGISYVLYSIAIKRVTAMEATLIPLLEPILNPLWVMLALGERPGPWAMVGAGMVVASVCIRGTAMVVRRNGVPPSVPSA